MSAFIAPDAWLHFIQSEYLTSYIQDGGCSVKFAVALDQQSERRVREGLSETSERLGYVVANVSASDTKIHMMDEVFFRTAEQLSWSGLSLQVIRELATHAGYVWPDTIIEEDGPPLFERIASENDIDPQMLHLDLNRKIANYVFTERKLAKDFRVAMTHLCLAELSGGPGSVQTTRVLTDWLTGRNRSIGALKHYQIFRKITRSTARYFFESMIEWVRLAGNPGLLLMMDTSRMLQPRNQQDGTLYYTKAAVLDSYEVLREFIDGADRVRGYFMVVLPGGTFLEDNDRGLNAYEALKFRVFDEIRDKKLVNPMGSLVRIASTKERGNA